MDAWLMFQHALFFEHHFALLLVIDPLLQLSILSPEYAMHMSASVPSLTPWPLMECLFLSLPNESFIYSSSSDA